MAESEIQINDGLQEQSFITVRENKSAINEEEAQAEETISSGSWSDAEETRTDEFESNNTKNNYVQIPHGFQSWATYNHASKNCEIGGVTYNSRQRQFVILDSRGITSWSYQSVTNTVTRNMNYPSYQFNVLRLMIYSRKFNVYFALSKEYALKVFNMNFHEVFSVSAEMHSVLCMVFNQVKNELITGGTGGMKFWTFGEVKSEKRKIWDRDSRPMANYGLVLRAEYPDMGGSWVKQLELDEVMQRLYCLSERHIVAYDMVGHQLFQIKEAHRGPVTGCVYSKACNVLVTAGNDCDVNVWTGNCRKVHTFTGHTRVITKIMLHPGTSSLVFTASMDGHVKVYSLDVMEELYSLPVHPEGIIWMNAVSSRLFYCCSYRVLEVFAINHVTDFWALTRCSLQSLSLVGGDGKSTRVMAVGDDSSVRMFSRKGQTLSTVLPPPSVSPLHQVLDIAYNRDTGMMYLLVSNTEIWVYYTRTNPATRLEAWELDLIEDAHYQYSQDLLGLSRSGTSLQANLHRSPSPSYGPSRSGSPFEGPPFCLSPGSPSEAMLHSHEEKVQCCSIGILYSHIIMDSVEGKACPDITSFLMVGLQDGRVLFLNMYCKGLKYWHLQAHKDAVLSVKHDRKNNTLVTQCRSFHGTLILQLWALPYLDLQQQVICDGDLTCFVRMDNLLMTGYSSGHLRLQEPDVDNSDNCTSLVADEMITDRKRTSSRDHQMAVSSLDANTSLGLFCSTSKDGFLKIWDKEKTLLMEIVLDSSLNAACFLNSQGDILIGYKQQIFIISHKKVHPVKERRRGQSTSLDENDFETESDIYEDPSVKYESKKILQPDPTNMENYLVPFPNLNLKTSWFMDMEGRAPPELTQNQQQQEEVTSVFSDDLSLAPTEIYRSPSSTPRTLSLVSVPILEQKIAQIAQEHEAPQNVWHLPECGDSPVSSPPRTLSPESTRPSTPSVEEESKEEKLEDKGQFVEEKLQQPLSCETCDVEVQKIKKEPDPSIFKREGGRLGKIKVDSSALRLAARSGGYAAPIVRTTTINKPEPKPIKPIRPPKAIVKKTRKARIEELAKKTDEDNKNSPLVEQQTQGNLEEENAPQQKESADQPLSITVRGNNDRAKHDIVTKDDEKTSEAIEKGQWAPTGRVRNIPLFVSLEKGSNEGGHSDIGQSSEVGECGPLTEEGKVNDKDGKGSEDLDEPGLVKNRGGMGRGISASTHYEQLEGEEESERIRARSTNSQETDVVHNLPQKPNTVKYIDPESGEVVECALADIPDGIEILKEVDDESENEQSYKVTEELPAKSSLKGERQTRKNKNVSFNVKNNQHGRTYGQSLRISDDAQKSTFDHGSLPARASYKRSKVLPLYEPQDGRDFEIRKSGNMTNGSVSPLTIFALARNRRQNLQKLEKNDSELKFTNQKNNTQVYQGRSVTNLKALGDSFNSEGEVSFKSQSVEDSRANGNSEAILTSARRSESNLMNWCIKALRKSSPSLLIPKKPVQSRPHSSEGRSTTANTSVEGETLFLKYHGENRRPKTAESYRSLATMSSVEEHSLYPYVCNPPPTPELKEEVGSTYGNPGDQNRYEIGLRRKKK